MTAASRAALEAPVPVGNLKQLAEARRELTRRVHETLGLRRDEVRIPQGAFVLVRLGLQYTTDPEAQRERVRHGNGFELAIDAPVVAGVLRHLERKAKGRAAARGGKVER